jgi:hypothetical protein
VWESETPDAREQDARETALSRRVKTSAGKAL